MKPNQVEKEFKENDHYSINQSNRLMEKQGYSVFNTKTFKKRSMGKTLRRGLLMPGLGAITGFDKWVKITYRLKPGEKKW